MKKSTQTMTVTDIVKKYLKENNYIGLKNNSWKCNCSIENIMPYRECFLDEAVSDFIPDNGIEK